MMTGAVPIGRALEKSAAFRTTGKVACTDDHLARSFDIIKNDIDLK
jgi:hypothetical protein